MHVSLHVLLAYMTAGYRGGWLAGGAVGGGGGGVGRRLSSTACSLALCCCCVQTPLMSPSGLFQARSAMLQLIWGSAGVGVAPRGTSVWCRLGTM